MTDRLRQHLRELTEDLATRDLAAGALLRHRRRRRRNLLTASAVTFMVMVAGGVIVDLPAEGGNGGGGVAPLDPPPASPSPAREPASLGGTFYYYQRTGPDNESIMVWTVGEKPRPLAAVGTADDLAVEHYAWQTSAVTGDGGRVAWRSRFGDLVVIDTADGDRRAIDPGQVGLGCHAPVWHPDGDRLLAHLGDSSGWFDVTDQQFQPIGVDLSQACAVSVFTTGTGEVALAYEDHSGHVVVGVTEGGHELWRLAVARVDEELDPDREVWGLVQVAPGGRHACLDIQRDVVGGAGGTRSLSGSVVVDTGTGEVVADSRPMDDLCVALTTNGYLTRVESMSGERQRLQLVGYDGVVLAEVEEPDALAFSTLISYSPPGS